MQECMLALVCRLIQDCGMRLLLVWISVIIILGVLVPEIAICG